MIFLILILLLLTGCDDGDSETIQPEIHLIPQGFIGHVTIYFDEPNGAPKKLQGNARVYEIPPNGKLRTRLSPNLGIRPPGSMQFYYVNAQGTRTLIPSRKDQNLSPKTVVVSGVYPFGKEAHYFIDRLDRINTYKNPAVSDSERQWDYKQKK